jgi:hypothetical protein
MRSNHRKSGNGMGFAHRDLIGLLAAAALAVGVVGAASGGAGPAGAPGHGTRVPTPTWTPLNEWTIAGAYAEACSDPPVCGSLFGVPPAEGRCRKVIALQIANGRYRNTDLGGLLAAVIIESPPGAQATQANRREWRRCDLLVPEQADSAQVAGLQATVGAMISGADGPPFTRVSRAPLAAGFSEQRILFEATGLLEMRLHPMKSFNGVRPPEIDNVAGPFPFIAIYYVYEPDTLFYAGAGEPWAWSKRSGLAARFVWTSQAAADLVEKKAERK